MTTLALAFNRDGATDWMVGIDLHTMRAVLHEIGGAEIEVLDLEEVLYSQYAGVALLAMP